MENERKECEAEEVAYRRSFLPIVAFEKVWLIVLLVCFCVGAAIAYRNRAARTLPPLSSENYSEYITIDLSLQERGGADCIYTGECLVKIAAKEGYRVTDLQLVLSFRKTGVLFQERYVYEFDALSDGESFTESEEVSIDLTRTELSLEQWRYLEIVCDVISASGGVEYAK